MPVTFFWFVNSCASLQSDPRKFFALANPSVSRYLISQFSQTIIFYLRHILCRNKFDVNIGAPQQIVRRERREILSQLAWCGGGCFDPRRRVNSTDMNRFSKSVRICVYLWLFTSSTSPAIHKEPSHDSLHRSLSSKGCSSDKP